MDRRFFLAAALALSGCATLPPPAPAKWPGPYLELEPLLSARAGPEGLVIRVASNGCTTKDNFAFHVEPRGGAITLAFARRRLDTCKVAPASEAELVFAWAELGLPPGAPVFLLNPLAAPRSAPRSAPGSAPLQ